ncbi:MAG: flagellar motor switch protein FliM [Calditrichaeota bacterium]|nr:flagellar motor switch protein FliM [Calditrichota bacterium]
MSKILTQEEIDALLSTVGSGPGGEAGAGRNVQVYDFKHPERISKDQMRTLRTIHDNFARMFGTSISTSLRTIVDLNLNAIDQVTFSEYAMSVRVPSALYILKMDAVGGDMILEISPQFLLFIVDRLLGGFGDTDVAPREITIVEQNVVQRVMQMMVNLLNDAWSPVQLLGLKIDSFESDPQFVQVARASESLAVIFFEARVRGANFPLNLVVPYLVLEPIMTKLTAQSALTLAARRAEQKDIESIRGRIIASKLPLRAVLSDTTLKIRDFIALGVDDILKLEHRISAPIAVIIADKMKYFGSPGRLGKRSAVRILRSVTPEEEIIYE